MARTKSPTTIDAGGGDIAPEVAESILRQQNEASERLALVVAQFGDGLPFDPHRYEYIIRDHLARSAESMLAAGRALIVARESLPHGEFMPFISRIGIEHSLAKRMMQAAVKFSDGATAKLVDAAGNKTKLFELLVLDDEEIEVLAQGGTVAGLELDDVERMSAGDLRKALREAREEKKAADQLMSEKNTAIDRLRAEITKTATRIQSTPPDEEAQALRAELTAQAHGAEHAVRGGTREAIAALTAHALEHGGDHGSVIAGVVAQIQQAIDDLRAEFAIAGVAPMRPEWAEE
ncbi:DUF3102 domain-containing protein [Alcaligenaceae bacterium]|nr:DUF3102 domain-containing protein [Alcaligenaceae bacterium]